MIQPLTFKQWLNWLKKTPITLKWYLIIILLRPFIDIFWYLKESSLASPLQITGILTFVFAALIILLNKHRYTIQPYLGLWIIFSIILGVNIVFVNSENQFLEGFGSVIRTILPFVLFFFIRNEIRSIHDINGILMSFLISSIFPYTVLLYETFFQPINIYELSEGRGGGIRLTGFYADLFNYMSYIIGDFIIFSSYYVSRTNSWKKISNFKFLLILCLTIIGLVGLKHQSSWAVFFMLILLLLIHTISRRQGRLLFLFTILTFFLVGDVFWREIISPLYKKEIRAFEGETAQDRILNGRIIRWERYFTIWGKMPPYTHIFGVGLEKDNTSQIMMSGGMHSDYVRFLFSTGFLGLMLYLTFFFALFRRTLRYPPPLRFFSRACITCLLLFSISSNPMGSSGAFLYLVLLGMTIATIPVKIFSTNSAKTISINEQRFNPHFR